MSLQPELERKVRQLDNDVQAIYVMMADISATQRRQGMRMEEIATTQAEHSAKLDAHSAKLDEHGAKLDEHGAKLDALATVQADHGAKLDAIIELLRAR